MSLWVMLLAWLGYGMLASGIIYDVIFVPPSSGQFVDGSGKARVLSMRLGRQNIGRQYIIEGLSAGFLVVAGSVGVMLLMVWQLLFMCMHALVFFWGVVKTYLTLFKLLDIFANSVFKSDRKFGRQQAALGQ
jgi:hypothetical protein